MQRKMIDNIKSNFDKEEIGCWLFMEYKQEIKKLALYYLRDNQIAEDISQEVLFTCFKNIHTLKGNSIKPWILRITKNKCIDYLRNKSHQQFLKSCELSENICSKEGNPEKTLLSKLSWMDIVSEINRLPTIYKEAITLFYIKDLNMEEISCRLMLNYNTVKTRIHRGKRLLYGTLTSSKR
jgi:RNA polymerase sigma-70 factor (ECF subfamily)